MSCAAEMKGVDLGVLYDGHLPQAEGGNTYRVMARFEIRHIVYGSDFFL